MNAAPRRRTGRHTSWRLYLVLGAVGLVAVILVGLGVGRSSGAPARGTSEPIIFAGVGTQQTTPFYLAGGTYHTQWSAWERQPEYPPCTHSAQLMAVDPDNAPASGGLVADLAKRVEVPATGGGAETYVLNLKPGDYYFDIRSACSWQLAIGPN